MLSAWMVALSVPRLNLSELEKPWTQEFWLLVIVSLSSFTAGYFLFKALFVRFPFWEKFRFLTKTGFSATRLRVVIYILFFLSVVGLFMFYSQAGDFPLTAEDTDVFRFEADEKVPGLINYSAQLARLMIPLAFFLMLHQGFTIKKHYDLVLLCLVGVISLILFASRTQIFFIDLWIMALYLLMRKPNFLQALKFYPIFLVISVVVLAVVPFYRQYKSYGTTDYLAGVTAIDSQSYNVAGKALLPIYVGVSFNMQSLLHAQQFYEANQIQQGRVTLDPFTNILGISGLASDYDLCQIFQCWWNTGTYLFPFVQDFGNAAFYFVPFIFAAALVFAWQYWKTVPNFLSINLYSYAIFFIVMTIYLSFTVRAEMYIDLALIYTTYAFITLRHD